MGRPINKRFFGANASNNIRVRFHNGSASVNGAVVSQRGSKKFKCVDASGNTAVCSLVSKADGSLAAGEMSIAFYNQSAATAYASRITNKWVYDYTSPIKKKYRYWVAAATTDNDYATDSATGTVGFVRVDAA